MKILSVITRPHVVSTS